jgi:Fe2+ or Zn2+ uptake regulation protein
MSNQYAEAAVETIYEAVEMMERYDVLQELRSREGFTAETYQIESLRGLLIDQRLQDLEDMEAAYT